jgi:hypothetical protein
MGFLSAEPITKRLCVIPIHIYDRVLVVLRITGISPRVLHAVVIKAAHRGIVTGCTIAVCLRRCLETSLCDERLKLSDRDFVRSEVKGLTDPDMVLGLLVHSG